MAQTDRGLSLGGTLAAVAAVAVLLTGGPGARAQEAPAAGVQLTGMRAWTNPGGTRVVLDFSAQVTPVSPDSGVGPQLVVAVPSPGISAAAGCPASLSVNDSAVVRVEALFDANGSPTRTGHFSENSCSHPLVMFNAASPKFTIRNPG